jgi:hypothetical protein
VTHFELCELTAKRFLKDSKVVLFEYQSIATMEYPDVLCFGNTTVLFEIKVDYQDFKKDDKKECRSKYEIKYFPHFSNLPKKFEKINWKAHGMEEFIKEAPHLGRYRYYVCPAGLILPHEVRNGWGLYWYQNNKFYLKKDSKRFRNNMHGEMRLLSHAFRKYASGCGDNILVKEYR